MFPNLIYSLNNKPDTRNPLRTKNKSTPIHPIFVVNEKRGIWSLTELGKNKKFQKLTKKLERAGRIDLSDPVTKWLWFALGFAIASVFLSIFFGGLLAGLAWSAAGICLIIWALKYFGVL